jgi:alpha-tubulin suppressor-like RCC1 family protein
MSSLTYPDSTTECTNILLIDASVKESSLFYTSVNATTFPIMYSRNSTKNDLLTLLQTKFTTIQRIAFVFHTTGPIVNTFLDNKPFFLDNEPTNSENVDFLIMLFNQFKVQNVDYLACNTLNYPNWVNYYQLLTTSTEVIVGASNNQTGNIKYGGDWIMENTSENIELTYFTKSIEYYTYLLGGNLSEVTFIISNNILYCTGNNFYGQLGLGNNDNKNTFRSIIIPSQTIKAVACGKYHTVVLTTNNSLYGTGFNENGQLGLGISNVTNHNTFQEITIPQGKIVKAVACGYRHTVILTTDNLLYGTGGNGTFDGQLGLGNNDNYYTFSSITIPDKLVKAVACGESHTLVLTTDNLLYGTGLNTSGQLGLDDNIDYYTFQSITIPGGRLVKAVACGANHTVVLTTDNLLYGTGLNTSGQLGLGTNDPNLGPDLTNRNTFQEITIPGKTIKEVACGANHTVFLTTDNLLYGVGNNQQSQLGLGLNERTYDKDKIESITIPEGKLVKAVTCGATHTVVLTTDNLLYGTGYNDSGELGLDNNDISDVFVSMFAGATVSYIMNMPEDNITEDNVTDNIIANICFPAGTPVLTDQGLIAIDKIDIELNTINQKRIIDITKTISKETFLVCFEKDALVNDKPSQETIISPGHQIMYEGIMHEAKWFIEKFPGVKAIPYTGEPLYNVLLEKHDVMNVNNLICETLLPDNPIAKFYTKQCKLSQENRDIMIKILQGCLDRNDITRYNQILQCC